MANGILRDIANPPRYIPRGDAGRAGRALGGAIAGAMNQNGPMQQQKMQANELKIQQARQELMAQKAEIGKAQAMHDAKLMAAIMNQPPEVQQTMFESVADEFQYPKTVQAFQTPQGLRFDQNKAQFIVDSARDLENQLKQQKPERFGSNIEAISQAEYGLPFSELQKAEKKRVLQLKHKGARELSAVQGTGLTKAQERRAEKADIILDKIQEAFNKVSHWTAGIGSVLKYIPGTPAKDLDAVIDTIKANIGFEELSAMREASKTGGALGQVTERELALLQSVISSLDTAQSPEQLRENLVDIQNRYNKVKQTFESMRQAQNAKPGDIITAPNGTKVRVIAVDPNGDPEVEPVK